MSIHRATHPEFVDGCFGCKIASINLAPSATPSRRGGAVAAEKNAMGKGWARDHDAYRRLVKNGLQPKVLDGCAELESRASTAVEIEHGLGAPSLLADLPKDAA